MNYALISIAINTVMALALFPSIGFLAVPISTAFAAWLQVGLLAQKLYRQKYFSPSAHLTSRLIRIMLASAGLGVFLLALEPYTDLMTQIFWGRQWIAIIAIAIIGMVAYGGFALAFGAARMSDYKSLLKRSNGDA